MIEFNEGDQIGPYIVNRWVGSGAFADVYQATNPILDLPVALKVIRLSSSTTMEVEGARIMCRLEHPNIVRVLYADHFEKQLVIGMEWVEGETLADYLETEGPLAIPVARSILAPVCHALAYLHQVEGKDQTGLAHLDLKPSNILLASDGRVKLTDFGLAGLISGREDRIGGSPGYMAPEQFHGNPGGCSDIWALGVLLHQMLTGKMPVQGRHFDEYRDRVLAGGFELDFDHLSDRAAGVILRCLEADPADRYQTAGDLLRGLGEELEERNRVCPSCQSVLPPGIDLCTECTFVEEKAPGPELFSRSRPKQNISKKMRERGRFLYVVLAFLGLVGAFLGYSYLVGWEIPSWQGQVRDLEVLRRSSIPGQSLAEREQILKAGLDELNPVEALASPLTARMEQINEALVAWEGVLMQLGSPGEDYPQKIGSLQRFIERYGDTDEAGRARDQLKLWETEYSRFETARGRDSARDARISERLAAWKTFIENQNTGFRLEFAVERKAHWARELERYEGWARLIVEAARGLGPADLEFLGRGSPDPFFRIIKPEGEVLYRSRIQSETASPVWNEGLRIHLSPGESFVLELYDDDPIGSDLLGSFPLTPFPPDGRFSLKEGSCEIELVIEREK